MPSPIADNARATRAGRSSPPSRLGVVAAFAAWAVGIGFAVPGRADEPAAIEGARKEAKLVIYTGVERAAAQIVINAFEKKYPFIAAETVRASSSKLATRLDAEIEANRVQGDIIEFSLLYLTTSLQRRAELLRYDSPEYAKYPDEYSAPGYWAASGLSNIIIMLNTRKVDEANVPHSWWDLAKPYWKDKLTIDNLEVSGTGYNWLTAIVNNESIGWKFIEALGRNKPGLERGHAGMAQKVAAGEYAGAAEMADFHLKNIRDAAASVPVRGVWPQEGVPSEPWTAAILKRAPHPNAARLFLDFLLSREGQTLYVRTMGWTSARSDVAPPGFKEMPREVKILKSSLSPDEALKVRDGYVAKWKQLWDLGKSLPN
jgi:iron(III) transport system substrate-binding protein